MRIALVTIETDDSRRHSREHRADDRARIEAWMSEQARRGTLVGGEAFDTEQLEPVTVRRDPGGNMTATEGPFAGERETLGGFLLVEVADRDEAVEVAASWPTGETIEVRPLCSAP